MSDRALSKVPVDLYFMQRYSVKCSLGAGYVAGYSGVPMVNPQIGEVSDKGRFYTLAITLGLIFAIFDPLPKFRIGGNKDGSPPELH